jgi:16S rRNA (adenine1518-N6/adenine1519-N6)-dimethyltransferase
VLRIDLGALRPAPDKVVANLPYGVAASALLRTVEELGGVELWVAMMQREVGQRLAAAPGTPAYGAPSVMAQLACEVEVLRGIARSVFYPGPNVDSVLVRLRRRDRASAPSEGTRALVAGAFAHRRKTLAGSLSLSPHPLCSRERVRAALEQLGHDARVRAERLSAEDFEALARALEL